MADDKPKRLIPHPPMELTNFIRQAMNAQMMHAEIARGMAADGWVFNEATQTWTHPERPGEMVTEG